MSTFYAADGVDWPYFDEVTVGVETPDAWRDMRMGAMFYYRTNRDQFGQRNTRRADERLHDVHASTCRTARAAPVASPKPTTATRLQPDPAARRARRTTSATTSRISTPNYKGVEFIGQQALLEELADGRPA